MPVKGIWSEVVLSLWPSGAGSWVDIGEVMLMARLDQRLWSIMVIGHLQYHNVES